jgi:hypothetical protein
VCARDGSVNVFILCQNQVDDGVKGKSISSNCLFGMTDLHTFVAEKLGWKLCLEETHRWQYICDGKRLTIVLGKFMSTVAFQMPNGRYQETHFNHVKKNSQGQLEWNTDWPKAAIELIKTLSRRLTFSELVAHFQSDRKTLELPIIFLEDERRHVMATLQHNGILIVDVNSTMLLAKLRIEQLPLLESLGPNVQFERPPQLVPSDVMQ